MGRKGIGGHHSAKAATTTWLTPRYILDALGTFDLDPCSAPDPKLWPTAGAHYTAPEDDGLTLPWFGRVWLNPPYSSPGIRAWMQKMAEHDRGMALIFARVETETYNRFVWPAASAILFLDHRPHFHDSHGVQATANCGAPLALIGYGNQDAEMLLDGVLPGAALPLTRPTMLYVAMRRDMPSQDQKTWRAIVADVVSGLDEDGACFSVGDIYAALANHPRIHHNLNWKAKIRQTIARSGYEKVGRDSYRACNSHAA